MYMGIAVFVGGGIGALARFALGSLLEQPRFFMGTLVANLLGSMLLAFLFRSGLPRSANREWTLLLTTGFCGGFTTYSTFNLETLRLFADGETGVGIGYLVATIAFCLIGGGIGWACGSLIAAK